jgi:hypothetical protein
MRDTWQVAELSSQVALVDEEKRHVLRPSRRMAYAAAGFVLRYRQTRLEVDASDHPALDQVAQAAGTAKRLAKSRRAVEREISRLDPERDADTIDALRRALAELERLADRHN